MKRVTIILLAFLPACGLLGTGEDASLSGKIVFSATELHDDEQPNIYTIRPDGSELTLLTDWEYGSGDPVWSPDGSQILFGSDNQSTTIGPALWVMNADGSDKHLLKEYPDPDDFPMPGRDARWSPDGEKVAFHLCLQCSIATNYDIYVYNKVTEELSQLADHPANETHPRWSPDGNSIAFISDRAYFDKDPPRPSQDLYVIDANGSNLKRLTTSGLADGPLWNPNGTTIVFRSTDSALGLYQINVQTGKTKKIWDTIGDDIDLMSPMSWSRDGTKLLVIAGSRSDNEDDSMYILDRETGEATRIPYGPSALLGADWYTGGDE